MEKTSKELVQVQLILKLTYAIIPIVAGADKFTNLLTNWTDYLNPLLIQILPVSADVFMMGIGLIEIIAGILVLFNTQKGAYLVSTWLVLIALNLLSSGKFLDIVVRDLAMAIGAYSLARISGILNTQNAAR